MKTRRNQFPWTTEAIYVRVKSHTGTEFLCDKVDRTLICVYLYPLGTHIFISRCKGTFEDEFPFPQVGYVSSVEGIY